MSFNVEGGIQVICDESILRPSVKYIVSVDQPRATRLFLHNGIPEDRVAQARLLLTESPPRNFGQAGGAFFPSELTIELYADVLFNNLRKKKPDSSPNETFLHESKHLINYVLRPNYETRMHTIFNRAQRTTLTVGGSALVAAVVIGSACNLVSERNEQGIADFARQLYVWGAGGGSSL